MTIEPVDIGSVPTSGRTGRPRSDRIAELENMVNLAVISGRVSIDVELEEGETSTLFRSRARAAGRRAGRTVRASVDNGRGVMVITSDEEDDGDGEG